MKVYRIRWSAALSWLRQRAPTGLIRNTSLGIVDQAVISGANFITMLYLARILGPTDYGLFALLMMALYLLLSLQTSLITSPHNILGATKTPEEYRAYTLSTTALQIALAAIVGLGVVATGVLLSELGIVPLSMTVALAAASITCQFQEFTRRVLFTELRIGAALMNDVLTYAMRLAAILFIVGRASTSVVQVLSIFALTWAVGALFGAVQIRASVGRSFARGVIRDHWRFGGWLLGGEIISHFPRYVAATAISLTLSVGAFGAYRAFEQLINGSNVLLQAIAGVLRPRLALEAKNGVESVNRILIFVATTAGLSLVVGAAVLVYFRDPVIRTVFGPDYQPYTVALFLLALIPVLRLERVLLTSALQAFRLTRPIFSSSLTGAVIGTLVGVPMFLIVGLPAAGAIEALYGVASLGWRAWVWHRVRKLENQRGSGS